MTGRLPTAHRTDAVAAVILFAIGAVLISVGGFERYTSAPLWVRFIPLAMVCFGVVLRRTRTGLALALGSVGIGIEMAVGVTLATFCIYTDNLYSFARYGPRRGLKVLFPITVGLVVAVGIWTSMAVEGDAAAVISMMAITALILISPLVTGIIVRQGHDRASLEAERAEQVTRFADMRRRESVLRERASMARELHDTVANYLSAIALQSTGLQARQDLDPELIDRSVAAIRQSSVDGLAELRRIIAILRSDDTGDDLASYRLDQLPALVERMRRAGLRIDYSADGTGAELPGGVQTAAYRVVQESLTNALKYGSDASVRCALAPDTLTVEVDNAVDRERAAVPGSGAGLVGMSERVRLLGGTVQAGPDGGRWRVRAELPIGEMSS